MEHLWRQLREAGYTERLFIDEWSYLAIRFESGTPYNKNISLLTLLSLLNDLGIPFAEDYTVVVTRGVHASASEWTCPSEGVS